ncbi:gamma-glutamylcyclotransferase family protein [Nocardioides daphniae]|uniref:gamma-glutamylcyclotransferase family protein n=1 Tax=Nocardioides daphniae TaxID=402297 RepID=UPI001EE975CB|nr:gamma-glutamylcyclotransferase family protein [Nocardioides daphniae]
MTLYAAYGTNLDPRRMSERCPHSPLRSTGWLTGWRLTFGGEELGWDGALVTLVEDPIEQVFVALYDVSPEDEAALDQWESADTGLYRKTRVRVAGMTGEVLAWTYVLDAYEGGLPARCTSARSPRPRRRPTRRPTTSPGCATGRAAPSATDQGGLPRSEAEAYVQLVAGHPAGEEHVGGQ